MEISQFFGNIINNIIKFFASNNITANIFIFAGIILIIIVIIMAVRISARKKEYAKLKEKTEKLAELLRQAQTTAKKTEEKTNMSFDEEKEQEVIVYKESKIADIINIADNLKKNGDYAVAARMLQNYGDDTDDIYIKKQCDMMAVECLIYGGSYTAACEKSMSMLEAQYRLTKTERRRLMAMVRAMLDL